MSHDGQDGLGDRGTDGETDDPPGVGKPDGVAERLTEAPGVSGELGDADGDFGARVPSGDGVAEPGDDNEGDGEGDGVGEPSSGGAAGGT
ncbi:MULTISPECIES: hypothetical protein [unclassified Streptomyces]|uniref:hypothetical protein n=1 Tax=unclassified Streptomyces TaxID=2593676 RepID=UPI003657386E